MKGFVLATVNIALAATLFLGEALAEPSRIYAANYELEFVAGPQNFSIQSRDRVRSGNEIPMELQSYKVGLQIMDAEDGEFLLRINVYERDGMSWFQINAPAPEFSGELGMPMDVTWESGELKIDLAIAVSEYHLQT
jgi:hypothetical protein